MKKLRRLFITGFLVLIPVLATADIFLWVIRRADSSARYYIPEGLIPFDFSGLGVVVAVTIIFIVGALTQNYIGTWIVKRLDQIVTKFPLVGGIYKAIKQFLETILNPQNDQFKQAVIAEFPKPGVYSIGFLTGEPDSRLAHGQKEKMVNVFFPMTPNPTSGFYVLFPESELIELKMPVQEAFKTLISMGIVTTEPPPTKKKSRRSR